MVEPTQPGDAGERLPSHRSLQSLLLGAGVVATGLILILTIGVTKPPSTAPPAPATSAGRPLAPPPDAAAPHAAVPAPQDRPRVSDLAELDTWARDLASPTKLPPTVLAAYGRAEMWLRGEAPACHLSWATLAGIGQVEAAGSGPLPVPPDIWARWSARATNDGKPADTKSVDDAAYTVGRYLCSAGGDLSTGDGWWHAVLGYTQSARDTQDILTATNTFASASLG